MIIESCDTQHTVYILNEDISSPYSDV